jgi:hypothetical protein
MRTTVSRQEANSTARQTDHQGRTTSNPLHAGGTSEGNPGALQLQSNPLQLVALDEELVQKQKNPLQFINGSQNPLQLTTRHQNPLQPAAREAPLLQKPERVKPTLQMKQGVAINDDKGLEHEADLMGEKAISYSPGKLVQPRLSAVDKRSAPIQAKFTKSVGGAVIGSLAAAITPIFTGLAGFDDLITAYTAADVAEAKTDFTTWIQEKKAGFALTPERQALLDTLIADVARGVHDSKEEITATAGPVVPAEVQRAEPKPDVKSGGGDKKEEDAGGQGGLLRQIGYTCYLYASLNSENGREEPGYLKSDVLTLLDALAQMANGQRPFGTSGSPGDLGYKVISPSKLQSEYDSGSSIVARNREKTGEDYVDHALAVIPMGDLVQIQDSGSGKAFNLTPAEVAKKYLLYSRSYQKPDKSGAKTFAEVTTRALNVFFSNIKAANSKDETKRRAALKTSLLANIAAFHELIETVGEIDPIDIPYLVKLLAMMEKKAQKTPPVAKTATAAAH